MGSGSLVLATTTSPYDTGLLDNVNPLFQESFGIQVETIAQGTGAAIQTARNGDADIILVHARRAEDQFISDGMGVNRRDVMFNDFVVIGPRDDPAGIQGTKSVIEAFADIARTQATFLSRGDDSGTNKRELILWEAANISPRGVWYQETGQGMGATLTQANQLSGYTLTDRGTYRSQADELALTIHVQGPLKGGPERLINPYGVIPVNPAVHDNLNYQAAMAYVGFLTSPAGQMAISEHTANGQQLFFPNALATAPQFDQYVPRGYADPTESTRRAQYRQWIETTASHDS
jgi:tungstate transport system substrate-binding protein